MDHKAAAEHYLKAERLVEGALQLDEEGADMSAHIAVALVHALLDVAAAIREQTKATAPRPGADLPDIARDYHTEAVESGVGVLEDINATLESVRTEIADLRAVVGKAARR